MPRRSAPAPVTPTAYASVDDAFRATANRVPRATACADVVGEVGYAELDELAGAVAAALRAAGCAQGDVVGVLAARDAGLLAALLGTMRAGAAYLPLDAGHPEARRRLLLDRAGARFLVRSAPDGPRALVVELLGDTAPSSARGDIAYVMFTSGSTGEPKGVQVGHRALLHAVRAAQDLVRIAEGERWLATTAASFDIAALELYVPLCHNAVVDILPGEVVRDADAVAARLDDSVPVAVAQATPTLWRAVIAAGWRGVSRPRVLCGGEALTADLARELAARSGAAWNVYGPTETTIWSTVAALRELPLDDLAPGAVVSIGRPFPGEHAYVVADDGGPAAPGAVGELWLGGEGVAEGYVGDPALTAERFVVAPEVGPGRLYRTGDLASAAADGTLSFHGRRDGQVKLRGHRVEPGEVEAVLRAAGARDAAVLVAGGDPATQRLVAFVAPPGDATGSDPATLAAALAAECARLLPPVLVPARISVVADWPTTATGKTDRRALEARVAEAPVPAAPETSGSPAERLVARAFSEVLGVTVTDRDASFFDLGGHSLMANQVVARLRAAGATVALRQLFQAPTVAGLATLVSAGGTHAAPGTDTAPEGDEAPPSFAQERLWFQDRLGATGPEHHVQAAFRLRGELDVDALCAALRTIVARHEPLRTVVVERAGRPVQRVLDEVPVDLGVVELYDVRPGDRLDAARRLMHAAFERRFSLDAPPLFRFGLYRLDEGDHVFHLCLHHICTDGWSMGVVAAEAMECYAAEVEEREPRLAPPGRYRDHAAREREAGDDPRAAERLAAVVERLRGFPTTTTVLPDHARPARHDITGGTVRHRLTGGDVASLREIARSRGTTLHSLLLAVYAALLAKHGAGERLVVAVPTANRATPEEERLVGVFVNTLPIPVEVAGDEAFGDLLDRVGDAVVEAMSAQDVPFERVVEALRIPRTLAHLPLTQVAFVMHNTPMPDLRLPSLRIESLPLDTGVSLYDLRLVAMEEGEDVLLQLDHATAVIGGSTAALLLDRYTDALRELAADGKEQAGAVPVGTLFARLRPRAATPDAAVEDTVPALFRHARDIDPGAVAVSCGTTTWTYAELDRHAGERAAQLWELGVRPGNVVGVMLDRGLDLVAVLLGVLSRGAAYVALDPSLPAARLATIARQAGIVALVTDTAHAAVHTDLAPRVLDVTTARPVPPVPPHAVLPDDLAYVTFTSGSTGTPKGAMIPHRALKGFWTGVEYARYGPGTTFLAHSAISWDAFSMELYGSILSGGRAHLVPDGVRTPDDLRAQVAQSAANTVWLTSTLFNALVDADPGCFHALDQVLVGGEVLSLTHVRAFRAVHPGKRLVNGYGPSECTVFATCFVIPEHVPETWTSVPIGAAVGDREVHVLDEALRPVPDLVPGELYVGGDAVGLGYLGRPDLTANAFVTDPGRPGRMLYRTGDLVRRRADGLLEFLGRTDDQVKLRGFRIELGEIERALTSHPQVSSAAVLHDPNDGAARLAAYVTPAGDADVDDALVAALRDHLAMLLPDFMLPRAIQVLDALPRTVTGKLDRAALPAPVWAAQDDPAAAPETETERRLARVWADVLGLDSVGIDDNFFDVGGDSISSIQVVVRARDEGVFVEPRDVFEHQTVRALAAVAGSARAVTVDQTPVTGAVPLAPIQRWMFGLELEDVHRFNQSLLLEFADDPGEEALRDALRAVTDHHDMLRARFTLEDGEWIQRVDPPGVDPALRVVTAKPHEDLAAQLDGEIAAAHRALDIGRGPLMYVTWIRAGRGGFLFVVCHHLVVDAYSWNVLLQDLFRALGAIRAARPVDLPERTAPYRDWVEANARWVRSDEAAAELAYWRRQAGPGIPWLRRDREPGNGREVHITRVGPEVTTPLLREVAAAAGVEPQEVMIGALVRALLDGTSGRELVVQLEHHGRAADALVERTVGWFTSLYPVLLQLDGDGPDAVVKAAKNAVRNVPGHGRGHGLLRYMAGHELPDDPDVRFNYLGRFDALEAAVEGVRRAEYPLGDHNSQARRWTLPLGVTALARGDVLEVRWDYAPGLLDAVTVARVAERWTELVAELTANCVTGGAAPALVPADFPRAGIDQAALDLLLKDL